jgi:hypothetical protein
MSTTKLETDLKKYPPQLKAHIAERIRESHVQDFVVFGFNDWLKSNPVVPDLLEAPNGWYKRLSGIVVFGEGPFIKTVGTEYRPVRPRPKQVDLDAWKVAASLGTYLQPLGWSLTVGTPSKILQTTI